ncbi:hypothetical protein ACGG0V_004587 [Salmonella enterica]|nr:hypothetical protein [Salmonella enterica]EKT1605376.1 hypothetical protein [Salmonella enterica]
MPFETTEPAVSISTTGILSEAMAIFTPGQITSELNLLIALLGAPVPSPESLTDEKWESIVSGFVGLLGFQNDTDMLRRAVELTTDSSRAYLAYQALRALEATKYSAEVIDHQSAATGLLLPASYCSRVRMLIGYSQLPVAWVRVLDVNKF